MGTDMHAFIDYDEWGLDQYGRPYLGCWTVAEIFVTRNYNLFELIASLRRGSIEIDLGNARRVDPEGMVHWDREHPDPFPLLEPKGPPDRLGWGKVKFELQRMGFVVPGDTLYGTPMSTHPNAPEGQRTTIYSWPPPKEGMDEHDFSWLSASELAEVADRYRSIPTTAIMERPPEGWGVDPRTGKELKAPGRVVYDQGRPELDGAVAMMERLNAGREDATRFVFWFVG
jgi:hypothetical protein